MPRRAGIYLNRDTERTPTEGQFWAEVCEGEDDKEVTIYSTGWYRQAGEARGEALKWMKANGIEEE